MALSKEQKTAVVTDITQLLNDSKLTVVANYKGVDVKSMQKLRAQAKNSNTTVKVVKNRLVMQALNQVENLKKVNTDALKEQLMYAFNPDDEVAPAQVLNNFAKSEHSLEFVGAITADGNFMSIEDVKVLANLPNKDQLRATLIGTLSAPASNFVGVLSSNIKGVLNVLNARAESL